MCIPDMDSLPSLGSLQAALINQDTDCEVSQPLGMKSQYALHSTHIGPNSQWRYNLKGWVPWTERTIPLDTVLKAPHETIIFMEG